MNSSVVLTLTAAVGIIGYLITRDHLAASSKYSSFGIIFLYGEDITTLQTINAGKIFHFLSVRNDAKVVCFYVVLIACVSPVIKSLTGSVATDSINACTTFLLLLRLVVHDYGTPVAM